MPPRATVPGFPRPRALLGWLLAGLLPGLAHAVEAPMAGPESSATTRLHRIKYFADREPQRAAEEIERLERSGLTLTPQESVRLELARAIVALGQVRTSEALKRAEGALIAAQALNDPLLLAEAHLAKGSAFYMLGNTNASMAEMERSLKISRDKGDVNLQVDALVIIVYLHLGLGDLEKAYFQLDQAEQLIPRGADLLRQASVADAAAELANSLGDDAGALERYRIAHDAYLKAENPLMASDMGRAMAFKLRALKRFDEALKVADETIVAAERLHDEYGVGMSEGGRGVALAALGRLPEALAASDRALRLVRRDEGPEARLSVVLSRIDILARHRKTDGLARFLAEAKALEKAPSLPDSRVRYHEVMAAGLAALGRHREAGEELQALVKVNTEWNAQRMARGLAAQRGQLESQRLAKDNELLRREAEANRRALEAAEGQSRLRLALVILLSITGVLALVSLWRQYERSRSMSDLVGTDPLTGAHNRRSIEELGEKAMSRCRHDNKPLTVAMLDIDHFKRVNDEHGHAAGDRVLKIVVAEMKRCLRDSDHLGRYGGEEFVVVLTDTTEEAAQAVAERLRQAIRSLSGELTGLSTPITISGGLALTTAEDQDFEAVVARADEALYSAKVLGRDRIVVRSAALQPSLAEGK